jgi:glycosyltransferase involved in cell wall biosynthesis/predicted O-methyltransferase YrrM
LDGSVCDVQEQIDMVLRKPRITIYSDDPGEGGVAVYNSRLAAGLTGLGYDVSIAQSKPESLARVESDPSIPHFWIPFHTRQDPQRNLTDTETAASVLRSARPDIVVFTNCAPVSQVAATIAAAELGIPYVIVEGFVAPPGPLSPHQAWMLHYQRLLYQKARAVVAVSRENLDLLRAHYGLHPRKGEVIHYGRPEEFFQPRNSAVRKERRASMRISDDVIVCLTSARFAEVKGFDHQIAAMQRLRGRPVWKRLHFLWAGDGPRREHYARRLVAEQLADHVTMPGHVADIAELLDTGDIFVLPSHHEGMPLSIMEAMAKGLAVAASAVSGIPEQLGETGRLLPDPKVDPDRTAEVLADAIEGWANDPAALIAEGEKCAARARSMFQENRMIRQMASVIERVALPAGDYVSPGLEMIRLDEHFPNLAVASKATLAWEYLRDEIPHTFYIDRRAPGNGFLNRDEAVLLHNLARLFRGRAGLEVGCWLGWSAAHIAAAGVALDVIDPVLGDPSFRDSVAGSLASAGLSHLVTLHAASSPAAIDDLGRAGKRWSFIFVDGNHTAPYPLFDTATAIEYAEPDAAVIFHDLASPEVAQALEYLACRGWKTHVYHTAQIMGIAWRGDVTPPIHIEDPDVSWPLAKHLRRFSPTI